MKSSTRARLFKWFWNGAMLMMTMGGPMFYIYMYIWHVSQFTVRPSIVLHDLSPKLSCYVFTKPLDDPPFIDATRHKLHVQSCMFSSYKLTLWQQDSLTPRGIIQKPIISTRRWFYLPVNKTSARIFESEGGRCNLTHKKKERSDNMTTWIKPLTTVLEISLTESINNTCIR